MHGYILSVSLQDRANSPIITKLKFVHGNELKKVTGYNFNPSGTVVEIANRVVPSLPNAAHPTTIRKVRPVAAVLDYHWVTALNPDGRRSNPIVPFTP